MELERRIVCSALWAAYGDALGFITELAEDERAVLQRLGSGSLPLTTTRPWRRNIGGRYGVQVPLPAGCYSDDTQLRLATSRAIRGSGEFDIEAFSRVELPIWLAYQLGGGKGTKAAAAALGKRSVSWMGNFYEKPARYVDAGGNGAAMRIQPHVWGAKDISDPSLYLGDVVKNSIVTHGHPRGFLGAALHALFLADTLKNTAITDPGRWGEVLDRLKLVPSIIREDEDLGTFWLPHWERMSRRSIDQAVDDILRECWVDLDQIRNGAFSTSWDYTQVVRRIGGLTPEHRGSGTKSALLALGLAWQFRHDPHEALKVAANCLKSDTDSIASLAGAMLGFAHAEPPRGEVADEQYITSEAVRVWQSRNHSGPSFQYPNLTKWVAPLSASSVVGIAENGRLAVAGLGFAQPLGDVISARSQSHGQWQWLELEFGQKVLARVRDPLPQLKPSALPGGDRQQARHTQKLQHSQLVQHRTDDRPHSPAWSEEHRVEASRERDIKTSQRQELSLDEATDYVLANGFAPQLIGELLLEFAQRPNGIELAAAFAAVVAKARIARIKRGSGTSPGSQRRNPPPPASNPEKGSPGASQQALPFD